MLKIIWKCIHLTRINWCKKKKKQILIKQNNHFSSSNWNHIRVYFVLLCYTDDINMIFRLLIIIYWTISSLCFSLRCCWSAAWPLVLRHGGSSCRIPVPYSGALCVLSAPAEVQASPFSLSAPRQTPRVTGILAIPGGTATRLRRAGAEVRQCW